MTLSKLICSTTALLMTAGVAHAQHSYLPVINDGSGQV